ncbi:recombinase family protein [Clostridium sp. D46t1_190503_E9]|uniref:recombinase family protein n=1 Tax=Clostridium sp. D46t1_190503_E9 TaxID=2787137 RepID=UPI0018983796|nr:recombinase family protein [Clostridium sp. D46t1_190503_E9]
MKGIAIYTRKSKFTGKGESIENQILKCKKFIEFKFNECDDINIYIDEGFTGRNENRPQYKEMMDKVKSGEINHIVLYQLNRFGRNARDIHNSLQICVDHDCIIYSANEGFDSSTSFGRAIIGIMASLAQLETEQLAERVKDNMYTLAKMGRWLGGQSPLGFDGTREYYFDENGKERSITELKPNKEELKIVELIYEKYLQEKSISQVSKWALSNHLKGKNGGDLNKSAINIILQNPVYVKSTKNILSYFEEQGYEVHGAANGNGLLRYGKKDEQIIATSKHKGVINSKDWLEVQNILKSNIDKAPRRGKTNTALLTSILKCSCGSSMNIAHSRLKDGKKMFYYQCAMKVASGGTRCKSKNINGPLLEEKLIEYLKNYSELQIIADLENTLKTSNELSSKLTAESLDTNIEQCNKSIKLLVNKLKVIEDLEISKIIISEISAEKEKITKLEKQREELLNDQASKSLSDSEIVEVLALISDFKNNIDSLEFNEKKKLLNEIIESIVIDNDEFIINFNIKKN